MWRDTKELRFSDERVEKVWVALENQVEAMLTKHADEVEALVEALLETQDLSNEEVLKLLGVNSLQIAKEEGREIESVLEQLGTSVQGLEHKRRQARIDAATAAADDEPHDSAALE
ncbi:MAG: hypothetical protein QGG31_01080 [Anaerolineales bacterium]|nr:hypothetical protein [Anaerolineales bacterium]